MALGGGLGVGGDVVARLRTVLEADHRDLDRGLKHGESASSRAFGVMTKAAAGFTVAFAAGAVKSIQAASNLGEQINKTSVVFGDAAKEIHAWAKTTASSIGISERAALEAAGTFGNMLVPAGLSRKEAAAMSKTMVQLAADMASFNNADPSEVLDALRAGLAGETEPLRRFGVFLNEDRIKAEALAAGIVKTTKSVGEIRDAQTKAELAQRNYNEAVSEHGPRSEEATRAQLALRSAQRVLNSELEGTVPKLSAAEKALATYNIITKDTKDSQGDFGRTSDSLANQQRSLTAELEDTAAALGQQLLPVAQEVLGVVVDLVHWTGEHDREVRTIIVSLGTLAGGILAVKAAMVGYESATRLSALATGKLDRAMKISTIGLALSVVTSLGVALFSLRNRTDENKAAFERVVGAIDRYRNALDSLKQAASDEKAEALRVRASRLALARARQAEQEALEEFGKGSQAHKEALLAVDQAELELDRARASRAQKHKQRLDAEKERETERFNLVKDFRTQARGFIEDQERLEEELARLRKSSPLTPEGGFDEDLVRLEEERAENADRYAAALRRQAATAREKGFKDIAVELERQADAIEYNNRILDPAESRRWARESKASVEEVRQAHEVLSTKLRDGKDRVHELGRAYKDNERDGKRARDIAREIREAVLDIPDKKRVDVDVQISFFGSGGVRFNAGGISGADGVVSAGIRGAVRSTVAGMSPAAFGMAPRGDVTTALWDELAIGAGFGLRVSSTYRPGAITSTGNPSLHGVYPAQAVDMTDGSSRGFGSPSMRAAFQAMAGRPGVDEVILSPYWWHPGSGISRIPASAGSVLADHWDHVHVGDRLGDGIVGTSTRRFGTGDGLKPLRKPPRRKVRDTDNKGRDIRRWETNREYRRRLAQIPVADLPTWIDLRIAKAELTRRDLKDDQRAWRQAERYLRRAKKTGWITRRQRIDVLRELTSVRDRLASLREERAQDEGRLTPAQAEEQARAFAEARTGFLGEFAANIFSSTAGGLTFGSSPLGGASSATPTGSPAAGAGSGGKNVTVNQYFAKPAEDPTPLMRTAQFAADAAFGSV